jgi:hypothetical protein
MNAGDPLDGLDDEIRDHLERDTQEHIDRGVTPNAARDAARRKFGNVALVKENARAVSIPVWFDQLLQDLRYAYSVALRTREIGVRMALGAERRDIMGMVLREGMAIAAVGLGLGVAAALTMTRVMASLLYEVGPTDPATFAVVSGVLGATTLAACCGPALRAARVEPLIALRYE